MQGEQEGEAAQLYLGYVTAHNVIDAGIQPSEEVKLVTRHQIIQAQRHSSSTHSDERGLAHAAKLPAPEIDICHAEGHVDPVKSLFELQAALQFRGTR
jgi:hypothetical protein